MRIKRLDERVELFKDFIMYCATSGADFKNQDSVFIRVWAKDSGILELATATQLCQELVRLPIYTVNHAAAWLGLSRRGVVEAYRSKRLPYIQPGREVLFLHEDLVNFAKERRYEL